MAKRVAYSAMMIALAMIFSYVETLIPLNFGVPGIKLGLANLVVLIGIFFLDKKQVFIIMIARIVLSGFMFGNMSAILYSLAGGIVSFFAMYLAKRFSKLSMVGISIVGGISHNIGQILIAMMIVKTKAIIMYLPVLMIAGVVTGMLVGMIASKVSKYIDKGGIHNAR